MFFTDTPELRKLEREMRQKPNFDRRNDDEKSEKENEGKSRNTDFSENGKSETKGKNDGGE